jgi:hypothetical protein
LIPLPLGSTMPGHWRLHILFWNILGTNITLALLFIHFKVEPFCFQNVFHLVASKNGKSFI